MLARYLSTKSKSFEPTKIAAAEAGARNYIAKVEKVMARSDGPWIYGGHGPTALDAHFVTFMARMGDVGHEDFLSPRLSRYLDAAFKTREWQSVMEGRHTIWPSVMGSKGEP